MGRELIPIDSRLIESVLSPIVDQPLTDMWRAFGQIFEFGEQLKFINRRGKEIERSKLRLKAVAPGCDWVVGRDGTLVVGSDDCWRKRRFFDRKTAPKDHEIRAKWRAANEFFKHVDAGSLTVRHIAADCIGVLKISLSEGYTLVVCPTSAVELDTWYFWNDDGKGISLYASGMYINDASEYTLESSAKEST